MFYPLSMVASLNDTSSLHEAVGVEHGIEQASPQVPSESGIRENFAIPQAFIPIEEFGNTCAWFESHTPAGYFLGQILNDTVLHIWVSQVWSSYGVKVENIQNLIKGFFLFRFFDLVHAQKVLSKGSRTICSSLLVLQPYTVGFNVENEGAVDVPMWVEFPGLPLLLSNFFYFFVDTIGQFVCFELEQFFSVQPS